MNHPRFLRVPKGQPGAGRFAKKYAAPIPKPPMPKPVVVVKGNDPVIGASLLKSMRGKTGGGVNVGTCTYGMAYNDGRFNEHIRDVCHARMHAVSDHCVAAGEIVRASLDYRGAQESFLSFMANESPFKDCFITKDAVEMIDVGILYDVTKPKSHVVAAAIAIRLVSEYADALKAWKHVKNLDIPAGLKYITLYFTTAMGGFTDSRTHTAFAGSILLKGLKGFAIDNTLVSWNEPSFTNSRGRYEIYRVFNGSAERYGFGEGRDTAGGLLRDQKKKLLGERKFGDPAVGGFGVEQIVNILQGAFK